MATVAFNQFVNPWALEAIGWWYYLVYCGWLVFELVFVLWFIVETKGALFVFSVTLPRLTQLVLLRAYTRRNSSNVRWC